MSNELIEVSKDLESKLGLTEFQKKVVEGALNLNTSQSAYQNKHFVTASQLTPYRMIKQCLLEIETRHHTWFNMNNKIKRKLLEIQLANREKSQSKDELQIAMIEVDIEDMENDIRIWRKKITQCEEDIHEFSNQVKLIVGDDEELLRKAFTYDEEEERQYWVTRMAKQAAMDMIAYGRIGSGNMDSIAMMPEEDQIMALATTLQYNERLMGGLSQISQAVNQGLLENKDHLPKFDVPQVTDKLLASDLLKDVQRPIESKVKPESI